MAITQDVIDRSGIGGGSINSRLSGLENRQTDNLQRSNDVQQQQIDLAKGNEKLAADKAAEMAPARQEMADKLKQPSAEMPKGEEIPEYKRPTMKPDDMKEAFGMLMAASMLTGASSRTPFNNVMTAMTGAMNGFMKEDERLVKDSLAEFDKNLVSIKEKNSQKRREIEDLWEKDKNDLNKLKGGLELIAAKYDDPMTLQAARSKSLSETAKLIDNNIKSTDAAIDRAYKMQEQAVQHHEKMLDRQATRAASQGAKDSEDTITRLAMAAIKGDPNVWKEIGSRKGSDATRAAVREKITQLGGDANSMMSNEAEYKALTKALADRQKYVSASGQFIKNMNSQIDLVRKYTKEGVAGEYDIVNKWIQSGRSAKGSPALREFDTALRGLAREHQRIVTGVTSNAQLHVAAQQTADELLNRNFNAEEIAATLDVMKHEANNAVKAGKDEVNEIKGEIGRLGNVIPTLPDEPKLPSAGASPLTPEEQKELDVLRKKHRG